MKPKEWLERHGIISSNEIEYFGELVINSDNTSSPYGTGLCFNPIDHTFSMVEHIENFKFEGMYFARRVSNNSSVAYFEAGFYRNDTFYGPGLKMTLDATKTIDPELYDVCNYNLDEDGNEEGPIIYLTSKNEYYIYQSIDNQYSDKRISFSYGKIFLEIFNESNNSYETLDAIECGWDYEAIYYNICPDYCFSFKTYGVRPAFATKVVTNKIKYEYHGALLTYLRDQNYIYDDKDNRVFTNTVTKYGIIDYENNNKYFGEIIENGKEGGYLRSGFGCFRNNKEKNAFLGSYHLSERKGLGLLLDNDNISYFGNYKSGKREGVIFERHKDYLIISRYKNDKREGNYYVIDNDTFNVTIKDKNNRVIKEILFDENKRVDVAIEKDDKLSPLYKEALKNYGLLYSLDDNLNIYITGVMNPNQNNFVIPDFVYCIRSNAFSSVKHCKEVIIEDGVKIIEARAFNGANKIANLRLPQTISVIEEDTFTSLSLKEVKIPRSIRLIKNGAFYTCNNLERVRFEDYSCVVEEKAFPKKFKDINGMNSKEDLERKEKEKIERENKNKRIIERIKKRKETKEKIFEKLGIFKDKAQKTWGDIKYEFSYFYRYKFKKFFKNVFGNIYDFFDDLFYKIGDFFKYDLPGFFEKLFRKKRSYSRSYYGDSIFDKILDFLKKLWEALLYILGAPIRLIKGVFSSDNALTLAGVVVLGIMAFLAISGLIQYISWDVVALWPKDKPFFNYNFEIMNFAMDKMSTLYYSNDLGLISALLLGVLFIIGLIVDLLLYLVMLVFVCLIPIIIQIIIQLGIVFALPVAITIYVLVNFIRNDNKVVDLSMLVISIALTVIYFIFMTRFL